MTPSIRDTCSLLFVPTNRAGYFAKAAASGTAAEPVFVMLAKAESAAEIEILAAQLHGITLIVLIERSRSLHNTAAIAAAHLQLQVFMLGGVDLAGELGARLTWVHLLHARGTRTCAVADTGLVGIDVPWLDIVNTVGLAAKTQRIAALGFRAKACIHPRQLEAVHSALAPTPGKIDEARRVITAAGPAGADAAAALPSSRLNDRPVALAAQRLLACAGGRAHALSH